MNAWSKAVRISTLHMDTPIYVDPNLVYMLTQEGAVRTSGQEHILGDNTSA